MPVCASRLVKVRDGKAIPYRSCIYVGKFMGKYWYIMHNYVKYMIGQGSKRTMKIWCRISDALRDRTLWQSLPREVRQVIVQIYGEPWFNNVRKRTIKLPVRKIMRDLRFVQDVLSEIGTMLEGMHLCYRCRSNIMSQLVEIVDKFRKEYGIELRWDETPQEYVSDLVGLAVEKLDSIMQMLAVPTNS